MDVYNVTLFGIHMKINPVAFTIPIGNGWNVYWYGIIIALGFFGALLYAYINSRRYGLNFDKLCDVIIVAVPVSIISARAYYLLFYQKSFEDFWDIHSGGMAIYGSVIGAAIAAVVMCKIRKVKLLDALDIASTGFLLGQAVGRWGNFFNQEAFGSATGSSFWGMTSENVEAELGVGKLAHPCFLYESIWCLIGFFILNHFSKKRRYSGEISLLYCIWYGLGRAVIESFRTDSLMLGSLRVSQILSVVICLAAAIVFALKAKKAKAESTSDYTPVFGDGGLNETDSSELNENKETVEDEEKEATDSEKQADNEQ